MKKFARYLIDPAAVPTTVAVLLLIGLNVFVLMSLLGARAVPLKSTPPAPAAESNVLPGLLPVDEQPDPELENLKQSALEDMLARYPEIRKYDDDQGWDTIRMRVTAYCPCYKCCGKYSDGRTASNHRIRSGDRFVAADKYFAFGTECIIPGYNNNRPVKVLDRGRLIRGYRLDVFFNSHSQAKKWGTKYLYVKIRRK